MMRIASGTATSRLDHLTGGRFLALVPFSFF
jgi:hypothetical protein